MQTFWEWLMAEARGPAVPSAVLQHYEAAFKDELRTVIQRTENPVLRKELVAMLDCPIRTRSGCRSFTDYIVGALLKNGVQHLADLEAALGYVAEKMLLPTTDAGEPRVTVFGGFEERPDYVGGNPLQARFQKYLQFAVNNIRKGRIPRLSDVEIRPPGSVSIGQGRGKKGDPFAGVSPNTIPARPSGSGDLGEMVGDIKALLSRKEAAYGFPLAALFQAMMDGMSSDEQRRRFGDRKVRAARQVIVQTVEEYARATDNAALLRLLTRFRDRQPGEPAAPTQRPTTAPRPVLSDKERDYRSIVSVIARFDRPVGSADLGRFRRRWLEYGPRNPGSGHPNRLQEVLAMMVEDGVLRANRTPQGAMVYVPGPNFDAYRNDTP